ncbi:hypothetical protein [Paracoccus salsus]|uniref:hypothetical protein n=1 Tax=Paracoccus salsus TaxID=2911061 RepID=UPI001F1DCB27|nr:hypothetical protein [Paracoccus salsus]MCF3973804.1 hypothetical protein [Paracoccus salsus]
MHARILVSVGLSALLAMPALAQQAETVTPTITAPEQPATRATDGQLQSEPATITPARKSNCARDKHVMS